ncbi:MAG: hypothetical protein FJ095_00715 [Deltaproteobacteria bacterium]|nr:hypothetical protein [Deltaproteobacteria bacterium]
MTEAPHHFKLAPSEPLHPVPVKNYSAEARARFRDNFLYALGFSFIYPRTTAERCRFGDKRVPSCGRRERDVDADRP